MRHGAQRGIVKPSLQTAGAKAAGRGQRAVAETVYKAGEHCELISLLIRAAFQQQTELQDVTSLVRDHAQPRKRSAAIRVHDVLIADESAGSALATAGLSTSLPFLSNAFLNGRNSRPIMNGLKASGTRTPPSSW